MAKHTTEQRGDRWHVVQDGASVADFASESEAAAHLADLEKNYAQLRDVEIFRAGTWNGDKYSVADLDAIVEAFPDAGFKPPVKLGHKESSGDRAFGWVNNLRRIGDRLVADLEDIPDKLHAVIRERGFDSVSSEIFWNLKRGEKTFKRALKAVALLGAEIPAVAGLKPLRESVMFDTDAAAHVHDLTMEDFDVSVNDAELKKLSEENAALKAEQEKLTAQLDEIKAKGGDDEAVKKLTQDLEASQSRLAKIEEERRQDRIATKTARCRVPAYRPMLTALYQVATQISERTVKFAEGDDEKDVAPEVVLDALVDKLNKDAERLFSELSPIGDLRRDDIRDEDETPAQTVDRLARKYMAEHKDTEYRDAMRAVLDADPELKTAYAQS